MSAAEGTRVCGRKEGSVCVAGAAVVRLEPPTQPLRISGVRGGVSVDREVSETEIQTPTMR